MDEARLAEIEREHMDLWHRNDVERDDSCDIHELLTEVRRLRIELADWKDAAAHRDRRWGRSLSEVD